MIQKGTILVPADKCGVLTVNTFHLYRGFSRRFSLFGDYIKISIRKTKPENFLTKKSKFQAGYDLKLLILFISNVTLSSFTIISTNQ